MFVDLHESWCSTHLPCVIDISVMSVRHSVKLRASFGPADPDVWMRPALKSDGSSCYEYILLYTDDALAISENAEGIRRREIGKYFELKEDSIGSPKLYLGGKVRRVQLDNGVFAWSFSSSQYVQAAVKNVEEYLAKPENCKWKIPSKAETPTQTT